MFTISNKLLGVLTLVALLGDGVSHAFGRVRNLVAGVPRVYNEPSAI